MKTSAIITTLAAVAAASPLQARDGPGHGSMAGMAGMGGASADAPKAPAAGLGAFAGLLSGTGGLDLGKLLQGAGGLDKIYSLLSPELMQQYGGLMTKFLQTTQINKMEELKPKLRADAKRVKIIYGPYKIRGTANKNKVGNGFSFDPSGTGYMYILDKDFPRDITLIDVNSQVTDESFVPIDVAKGLYNHHNVFYDLSSKPTQVTACASGKKTMNIPINIFMGGATESTGQPYTSADGKFNSGFYLNKTANIVSMIDIVNYKPEDQTVYVVSEMEYVPGKIADALPASSQIIDIGMCDAKTGLFVHAPEGKKQWTINSSDIKITNDGYFLAAKAHFHDGAVNMLAYVNGKEVCNSEAIYGGEGREGTQLDGTKWTALAGTSVCPQVIPVKKGDTLKFVANFDIAKHPEREQETGHNDGGHGEGGMEMGAMAEGMALFTGSFATEVPGANSKWTAPA